jgi:LmbE family N-acetylglucosaminyl deacetylase
MAGGTIAKLIEQRNDVEVLTLSHIYQEQDLISEWHASMEVLGVEKLNKTSKSFVSRRFYEQRDGILQSLFKFDSLGFDYVFIPNQTDFHSDHSVVAKAAIRVFKHSNLLSWLPEWNQRQFVKNYFVKLEHRHVQKKLEALACYKSQLHRPYFNQDVIVGGMHVNGMMCNTTFAEAFQVINLIK